MDALEQPTSADEERVDEAVAESFPASDAPAWNATHVGAPSLRVAAAQPTPEAVRGLLRSDIERLRRSSASPAEVVHGREEREETVSRGLLDAGRAVVREPVDAAVPIRTLESEQPGSMRDASCVVVGARYDRDDVSGIAALLAVSRAVVGMDLLRNVRFVGFANGPAAVGSERYVERLSKNGVSVHAMISLERMDLARGQDGSLLFVGNLRSFRVVRAAAQAFERASRIGVRSFVLPSLIPGARASDHAAFWGSGWPALMIADGPPWRLRSPGVPDVDRIAAALPGLVAAVARLANT